MTVYARQSYMTSFGKLHITRGTGIILDDDDKVIGQIKLYAWDVLPRCRQAECTCSDICVYFNSESNKERERCMVIGSYLKKVTDVILGNLGESITEVQLFRVGTNLIPLYRNFARMKLEEAGLDSPLVTSKMGNQIPNPIYKDIRESVKMIDMLWKSIGLQTMDEKFNLPQPDLSPSEGDYSYYDTLEQQIAGEIKTPEATRALSKMDRESAKGGIRKNPKLKLRKSVYTFANIPNEARDPALSKIQRKRRMKEGLRDEM